MKKRNKLVALLLTMALAVTMLPTGFVPTAKAAEVTEITFNNTSNDGGKNIISMTEKRTFEVVYALPEGTSTAEAEAIAEDGVWSLTRTKGYLNESQYPNYYKGTLLTDWMQNRVSGINTNFFTDINTKVSEDGKSIVLNFANDYLFGLVAVNDRTIRQRMMDYVGDYDLALTYNDEVIGSTTVKLNAYDSYHTMDEFYTDIDEVVAKASKLDNIYVEKRSLGTSTGGLDMPYLVIAKNQAAVEQWLSLCDQAEVDPEAVIAKIENGTLKDFQVPVLYSNIHSDETVGADCVMEFAWDLVNAAAGETTEYRYIDGFTAEGEEQLKTELELRNQAVSPLTEKYTKWFGELTGSEKQVSTTVDLDRYYKMGNGSLDQKALAAMFEDLFFIIVPEENVDGRTYNTRYAAGGIDLNRDNSFQTQKETQFMTHMIANWNPVAFLEMHGFVSAFQAEPCDPPHEPNFEYDILAEHLMSGGEAFASGAVSNNKLYNSCVMPQRDYLKKTDDPASSTGYVWEDPWDDMSTSYTPQYSMLHGTVAYTVEAPAANEDAVKAGEYGLLTHALHVAGDKVSYFKNQCKIFARGVKNEDSDEVDPWYTDIYDKAGAEADIFRPKNEENDNFFPECYIIPLDAANQKNLDSAYDMLNWLVRNDVAVTLSTDSFTYNNVVYPKGTMIVSMYQAKRGVANGVLHDGVLIENWSQLYSEPITAFNYTRGFDMTACTNKAVYQQIAKVMGDRIAYDEEKNYAAGIVDASQFTGVSGHDVIITNVSTDSTAAINALLKKGKTVGMITEGAHKGDFVVSYNNWLKVCDDYTLTGIGINEKIAGTYDLAGIPTVYINGVPVPTTTTGYIGYNYVSNASSNYNFDRHSMEMMNFNVTTDPKQADFILGNRALSGDALAEVKKGTPYIGYGGTALNSVASKLLSADQFDYNYVEKEDGNIGSMDALFYCTYPTDSMITASKVTHKDDVMYGYGVYYMTKIPEKAQVLVQVDGSKGNGTSNDILLEGFIPACDAQKEFLKNSIQGMSYAGEDKDGNQVDLTVFANTLTNKMHQEDEFILIENTIFSKMLTKDAYDFRDSKEATPEQKPEQKPEQNVNQNQNVTKPAVTLGKVSIKSFKNVKKGTAKVVFKKVVNASKYEIFYSNIKGLKKSVNTVTTKKTSYTFKKLKKGKTYYVKVRAIKGNTVGKWSAVKKVKIKK